MSAQPPKGASTASAPGRPQPGLRWSLLGIALLLAAWQLVASVFGALLIASPLATAKALWAMLGEARFRADLLVTLSRIGMGVGLSALLGIGCGLAAGLDARVRRLLEPARWLLTATPPVVVLLLAMIWFGMGSRMVVFMTMLVLAPGLYVNTLKGMLTIDTQLIEMARVFSFGLTARLRHVYLPAVAAPLCAAWLMALCAGVRIVVMAEVLGAQDGLGFVLAGASSAFDSERVYAVVLAALAIVALLEFALLRPLERRLTAYTGGSAP